MRIHHVALRVADPERSAAFYQDVLRLPERRRTVERGALRAVWLGADGAILMLERSQGCMQEGRGILARSRG